MKIDNPFGRQAEYHKRQAEIWSKRKTIAGIIFVIAVIYCFYC